MNVSRVAVIGAGPTGLAAAKYLLAEKFQRIDVFEKQSEVGGVWYYSAKPSSTLKVPQTDPRLSPDPPVYSPGENGDAKVIPLFPSPMYDDLNTNIPHTIMKYSDLAFRDGCEIFPTRQDVQDYLVKYAKDVRHLIKFSTQVTNIALRQDQQQRDQWDISTKDLITGNEAQDTYDAVVVASGHYSTPYIPDTIENISEFHAAHPGSISHSKLYRNAEPYRNKKAVVVGTGASGLDIASQIQRVCKPPLIISAQTEAPTETLEHLGKVEQRGQIKRFHAEERAVEFEGDDGHIEKDVDAVLFCTGYLFTFPFLTLDPPLITDGRKVHGLAKHFLHVAHPTIAFPGLPIKVIPFPLAESQASIFSRIWSNRVPLPSRETLEAWERADAEAAIPGKYHVFPKGGDGRYINEVHEWATQNTKKTGDDDSVGKEPPYWDDELLWQRSIYAEAKMQFEKTGRKAKTLAELGFRYEPKKVEGTTLEDAKRKDPQLDVAG
ncbi:FAD/NAD(P)-binding domain-containing protein [Hypoxylon sp. FL1150]|nr:FAD/NAD(P)-binding domain-containing protein [Hypoxylon sp. FL1150]